MTNGEENCPGDIKLAATVRTRKRKSPSTPILDQNLVAVLVAVGYPFLCDSMRHSARLPRPLSTHSRKLIRDNATPCEALQNGKKRTQNPPEATPWGFDSPLPAPSNVFICNHLRTAGGLCQCFGYKYSTAHIHFIFNMLSIYGAQPLAALYI
jgi:hypothetical protein